MIGQKILQKRKELSLSQRELSCLSGLSLATIQNIEWDRANPSLKVLEQIGKILGFQFDLKEAPFCWESLAFFSGAITSKKEFKNQTLTKEGLSVFLRRASLELQNKKPKDNRIKEAFESLLLAVKTHYPSIYKKHKTIYEKVFPKTITGKHIKLRRIALSYIGNYL